jgi:hypothetical protein
VREKGGGRAREAKTERERSGERERERERLRERENLVHGAPRRQRRTVRPQGVVAVCVCVCVCAFVCALWSAQDIRRRLVAAGGAACPHSPTRLAFSRPPPSPPFPPISPAICLSLARSLVQRRRPPRAAGRWTSPWSQGFRKRRGEGW